MPDIFISYSRKDLEPVKSIKEELERLGFSCWMDLVGIESGSRDFSSHIIKAIDASNTLLFFLSVDSQISQWALKEIDYATGEGKHVVLVRFNDDPLTKKFRFDFNRTDIIDWRRPEQKEKLLGDLRQWTEERVRQTGVGAPSVATAQAESSDASGDAIPALLATLYPEASFVSSVGSGAYGAVWLALFPDGTWRAVKLVSAAPDRPGTAAREFRAVRLLLSLVDPAAPPGTPLHPALLQVLDLRETPDGSSFAYAMPLADSLRPSWQSDPAQYRPRTLAADLLARRALPLPECLDLAESLASALDCLQRHCLVHRDIKPSNVLYLSGRPVLADFGLLADTREAASVVGTPGYVPGEQHGRFPADLYSLGILLTEALTGRPASETGYAPVPEADTSHPLYPRFLALLRRATDPNPARRPQTAAAFLADLRALRAPPRRRPRILAWLAALALLLALLAAPLLLSPRHPSSAPPTGGAGVPPAVTSSPPASVNSPSPPVPESPSQPTPQPPQPSEPPEPSEPSQPPPPPAPAPPLPATNRPLIYISSDWTDSGTFVQLYTDRIRVGLPLRGYTAEDASLLLVPPPDDPAYYADPDAVWTGPVPWRLVPLAPATPDNTPPTAAQDPVFPTDAPYPARTTHAAIAHLPADLPYPEAIFLLPAPSYVWEPRLSALTSPTFDDIEHLWWSACELPRFNREADEALREAESNPLLRGDFF